MAVPTIRADSPRAWVAAIAVAAANGIAFGTAYTFGTFFESMADEFGSERGSTALLFGLTLLCFFGFGIVSGPLSDRYGQHRLLAVGAAMFVGGLLLTSQVNSVAVGYLTYGIGVGIGAGCFTAPLTAFVGQLFVVKRALALGVVATGNGLGTLILSPVAERLIDAEGWRAGYRTLALVAAVIFVLAVPAVRGRGSAAPSEREATSPANNAFVRSPLFQAMFASGLLMSIGLFVAFAFVVPFATDEGISSSGATRLVALIGLSSIVGRLALTNASNRYGPIRVFQAALFVQPLAFLIWLVAGGNYALLVLFAVVLGVSYGGFVAVSPAVVIDLLGIEHLGRKMGAMFLSFGVGGLIGPPLAGFLADATSGRTVPILVVTVVLVAACVTSLQLSRQSSLDAQSVAVPSR